MMIIMMMYRWYAVSLSLYHNTTQYKGMHGHVHPIHQHVRRNIWYLSQGILHTRVFRFFNESHQLYTWSEFNEPALNIQPITAEPHNHIDAIIDIRWWTIYIYTIVVGIVQFSYFADYVNHGFWYCVCVCVSISMFCVLAWPMDCLHIDAQPSSSRRHTNRTCITQKVQLFTGFHIRNNT